MEAYQQLLQYADQVGSRLNLRPELGIVLGSGLSPLADRLMEVQTIPYADLEGFPQSTAPGHEGAFLAGRLFGLPVILMKGRIHLYEGYSPQECVLPIRLMGLLGIRTLLLTNAAGACNRDYQVGDLVVVRDHISVLVPSALRGPNMDELGPRFPDVSEIYHPDLRRMLREAVEENGGRPREGVYMQFAGPAYETPAEVRMAQLLGADLCGMSTAIEATAAHHMGIPQIGALSLATNMAAGLGGKLSEEEVIEEGKKASARLVRVIESFIGKLA